MEDVNSWLRDTHEFNHNWATMKSNDPTVYTCSMWPCWVTQISSLNNLWTRGFFCYIWHFLNRIYSLSCWLFSWAMEVNVNINKYKNGQTISSACDSCVQIVSVFVYIWLSWKMCKTNFQNEQIKASCLFLSTYPCQT